MTTTIFHYAFLSNDLEATRDFYINKLGAELLMSSERHGIVFNFFGHQLAALRTEQALPEITPESTGIAHFGVIFTDKPQYRELLEKLDTHQIQTYRHSTRFLGKLQEHESLYFVDPTNNLIELKYYKHWEGVLSSNLREASSRPA